MDERMDRTAARRVRTAGILIAAVVLAPHPANAKVPPRSHTFHSPTAGFTITKPESWVFATTEQIARNRARVRLKDKELEALVRERASLPLVAAAKHPEPYDDLNPSVQVLLRPLGSLAGKSPVELMQIAIVPIQRAVSGFEYVETVRGSSLNGRQAAYVKCGYTVANAAGRTFPTLTRLWLVPRGQVLFMVSMSGPRQGPDVSEGEFAAILKSIKIDD
jgi:hypothetical protein